MAMKNRAMKSKIWQWKIGQWKAKHGNEKGKETAARHYLRCIASHGLTASKEAVRVHKHVNDGCGKIPWTNIQLWGSHFLPNPRFLVTHFAKSILTASHNTDQKIYDCHLWFTKVGGKYRLNFLICMLWYSRRMGTILFTK